MMPLSITGMGAAVVLGIAAVAPCRAQTFDPDGSVKNLGQPACRSQVDQPG